MPHFRSHEPWHAVSNQALRQLPFYVACDAVTM